MKFIIVTSNAPMMLLESYNILDYPSYQSSFTNLINILIFPPNKNSKTKPNNKPKSQQLNDRHTIKILKPDNSSRQS